MLSAILKSLPAAAIPGLILLDGYLFFRGLRLGVVVEFLAPTNSSAVATMTPMTTPMPIPSTLPVSFNYAGLALFILVLALGVLTGTVILYHRIYAGVRTKSVSPHDSSSQASNEVPSSLLEAESPDPPLPELEFDDSPLPSMSAIRGSTTNDPSTLPIYLFAVILRAQLVKARTESAKAECRATELARKIWALQKHNLQLSNYILVLQGMRVPPMFMYRGLVPPPITVRTVR
ncbi:hypothetical protein D9615_003182 [Tricholomella constricta]|uniref:Uncharacterized protein n=1 Tax=Tricholomella constricta TaxID=117010 RepID=A0A8H5M813_9AGAR|nr:hypothetical protein D9615_003182 [Tricholomella constricta]